ncbi:uncharacterized protein HGUI_00410 [Hanseniaspora guilliermondii]|uniref:Sfi1 spindle body domain-containing protein n=1 Tax=Hanseniaspora guilliermondii TaxID=56406 RepID=A0A1L0AUG6_9ASCO|nr:uncharacterized protein HGUI_00410 [Hanseniaspora guilliermondii]
MDLNDTEFLLKEEPLIQSIDTSQEFSTEYLLNHSFEADNVYKKIELQDSEQLVKASKTVIKENTEHDVAIQDALIIQTHSAIHSLLNYHKVAKDYNEVKGDLDHDTLKTFLSIFENYCYLIRFYEFQLYVTNKDKYIRFLANLFEVNTVEQIMYTDEFNMFVEIVRTFVHEPTNIYMRLSKSLLEKSNRLKTRIFLSWKNKYKIHKPSIMISKKKDTELKRFFLVKICDEFRATNHELFEKEKITLVRSFERVFRMWAEKKLLKEHFINFGNELVKERFFKNVFLLKRKHLLHISEEATSKVNKKIKRKVLEFLRHQGNLIKTAEDIQNNFVRERIKQKYFDEMKHAFISFEHINRQPHVSLKKKMLKQMVLNARLIREGDTRYFDFMKQKCWNSIQKKLILIKLEKKYLKAVKGKNFLLLRQKLHNINKKKALAISTEDLLLRKRVLINWKTKRIFGKALVDAANNNNQICSAIIRSTMNKWRIMIHNIKDEKLLFFERTYKEEVSALVAREFIYRKILCQYMKLKKNQEMAAKSHSVNTKRAFFLRSRDTLGAIGNQISQATMYRTQAVIDFDFAKWRLYLYVTRSHDELVTAFVNKKIVSDLSRLLYNWNLKIMRNETMQTPLSTHLKRWKRAQIRGALEIWLEKLKSKEESIKMEIKTPFRPYQMHKPFDGTVERGNMSKKILRSIPLEEKNLVNENVFSSEYKSSKIKEKKEILKSLTPSTRFSKELLKPSPVKRHNLKTRIDNNPMMKNYFNSEDYLLSHIGFKDNKFSSNTVKLDETSFNTPMSTSTKLNHKNSLKSHKFLSVEEDDGEFLPSLK